MALAIFIIVVILNVAGLLLDAWLKTNGLPTITKYVRQHPVAMLAIVVLELVGVIALYLHFTKET